MQFKDIVGHIELKNRLIQTVLNHRVSHAQLFLGAEGSEKLSLAIAYAQFIACKNKQFYGDIHGLQADSCGSCPSCMKYHKLAHPDLHFIFPVATNKNITSKPVSSQFLTEWRKALLESNCYLNLNEWYEKIGIENKQGRIGVDDANQIIKTLSMSSYEGEYKVMIIWMVEKLYHAAAPKLLKILEEPPEKTLFILIAEDTNSILKTILSRTQLLKLLPLQSEDISQYLNSNFQMSAEKTEALINLADGNFKNIIPVLSNQSENPPYFEDFRGAMLLAYKSDFRGITQKSDELAKIGRENLKAFLEYGLRIVRMCLYQGMGRSELVKSSHQELEFIQKFSRFIHTNNITPISEILNEAGSHIERNVNSKLVMTDSLLRIGQWLQMPK